MKKRRTLAWSVEAVFVIGMVVGAASFAHGQQTKTAAVEASGKEWLALMDKDNDGTVDKQEFLNYMGTEFDKADVDHDGTLDARELGQLRLKLGGGNRH